MNILVTGAAGFIGSNLMEKLDNGQNKLYWYDTLHTGRPDNLKGVKCKQIDFKKDKLDKIDYIFHLGMPSSSPMYKSNPFLTDNAVRTFVWIWEMARCYDSKVIFASTSSLYNGNSPPFRENMPVQIKDYYTEIRYWMERFAQLYSEQYNVPSVGLRLFSAYGKNDYKKGQYANVVTQFAVNALLGKEILIYGDGEQSRDFTHVDDITDAFISAMDYDKFNIFNIGTGKSFSFNNAVDMIEKYMGEPLNVKYTKNQVHNYVFDTQADTTKATRYLGFKAKNIFNNAFPEYLDQLAKIFPQEKPKEKTEPPKILERDL